VAQEAEQIVAAIRGVVGPGDVALHEPRFEGNELAYLRECLESTFVSSIGPFVGRFEAELAAYTGARHAVAVVNGTAALQVALELAGVGSGDEVLVPSLSFVAIANAVVYRGAIPHFVDSSPETLGVDPGPLRDWLKATTERRGGVRVNRSTGRPIRALVPMHAFGHPVDMEGVLEVARDFGLALVEDAAEALGSFWRGRHAGTLGLMGVLSFNGNKTITTGGGGAILTEDPELARLAKHLTTTARRPHRWAYAHDRVGYNFRMPNINAALGCAQLERLDALLAAKRRLHGLYRDAFTDAPGVTLVTEPPGCRSNYWLQTLVLKGADRARRDAVLEATNAVGITTRPVWTLLHRLDHFEDCPRMELPVAERLETELVNLPSSPHLGGSAE
jgi:perosamine synthetase